MTASDYVSLISSIASGVLAVVALALAIVFFILSKKDAERSEQNAQQIASSVRQLEKLFDTLYSDTFSMMRETYTDMRRHVWRANPDRGEDADAENEEAATLTKQTSAILEKVAEASAQIGVTGAKLEALQQRLQPALRETLEAESVKREDSNSLQARVIRFIATRESAGKGVRLREIVRALGDDEDDVVTVLFDLGRSGVVDWENAPDLLGLEDEIQYVPVRSRAALRRRRKQNQPESAEQPDKSTSQDS